MMLDEVCQGKNEGCRSGGLDLQAVLTFCASLATKAETRFPKGAEPVVEYYPAK